MIFAKGRIWDSAEADRLLDGLEGQILNTLSHPPPSPRTVAAACGRVMNRIEEKPFFCLLENLGFDSAMAREILLDARRLFSEKSLIHRLCTELGQSWEGPRMVLPPGETEMVEERLLPLGVLLHIAAGNVDALPAFTALEGLLCGNINILKLPSEEGGISIRILSELVREEPALAEYLYVFDYSSRDVENLRRLEQLADAVVLWGGDEAVKAVRSMISPNTQLIEWGHKLSFAYVSGEDWEYADLEGLAEGICRSDQLLCSSCQGIFIDTVEMETVHAFCRRFLPVLEKAAAAAPRSYNLSMQGQLTLRLYEQSLELDGRRIFAGDGCSLIACRDNRLESSIQFRNPWVKALPRENLIKTLRPHKAHLQTTALLCSKEDRAELTQMLWQTGVVRVTGGNQMSYVYCGAAHDGEYPLRRYVRLVTDEWKLGTNVLKIT
jgi:hypothetical protein